MSSLRDSYKRITYTNGVTLQERAEKLGILKQVVDRWIIPAESQVYARILIPSKEVSTIGLLGREIIGFDQGGARYKVWLGATDIVLEDPSDPYIPPNNSNAQFDRVASVTLPSSNPVEEIWIPKTGQGSSAPGSFERIEEIRRQPENTEFIVEIENNNTSPSEVKLRLVYIDDSTGLIIRPLGVGE